MNWLSSHISKILIALSALIVAVSVCVAGFVVVSQTGSSLDGAPYYTSKFNSNLEVQSDGSIHAVDQREFTVLQDSPDIQWTLNNVGEKDNLHINSVVVSLLDEEGQVVNTHRLSKAAFDISWALNGESLDFAAFDFDYSSRAMHLYTSGFANTQGGASPKTILVTTDYTVKKVALAYRDTGAFSWTVVPGTNSTATNDVSLTVFLPTQMSSEDPIVRTWSHGPEGAQLAMDDDYVISFHVDQVDVWQYAQVDVVFPVQWLSSLPEDVARLHANELYLDNATVKLLAWADTWHLRSMNAYAFDMAVIGLCIALCLMALGLYFMYGKTRKPDFTDEYLDCIPRDGLHPAIASRVWRWDRPHVEDLRAAIVHLVSIGAITVEDAGDASAAQNDTNRVAGYKLTKVPFVADKLDNPIDKCTLWLLFTVVANRANSVRVQELRAFKRDHSDKFNEAIEKWQAALSESMNKEEFFENAGKRWQTRLFLLALVVFAIGIALFLLFDHPVTVAVCSASALVIALVANYIPRRTVEGNNITARCKALRNWLRDENDCEDPEKLCSLMPYACAFNIGGGALDKAAKLSEKCSTEGFGILDDEDAHWRCCYVTCLLKGLVR